MDDLIEGSLRPENSYTLSSSTIGAFPSIMTSTRPLSYGGFDVGAHGRPPILAAQLARSGYRCSHLTTIHWVNSWFGYAGGLSEEELLIHPSALARSVRKLLEGPLHRLALAEEDQDAVALECQRLIHLYLQGMRDFWSTYHAENRVAFSNSTVGKHRFNTDRLLTYFEAQLSDFERDPSAYARAAAAHQLATGRFIADQDWRLYRSPGDQIEMFRRGAAEHLAGLFSKRMAAQIRHPLKPFPDAQTLVDRILACADKNDDRPFFIWSHLFDAHIPFTSGAGPAWRKDISRWLRRAGVDDKVDPSIALLTRPKTPAEWNGWCALYDAAVSFISFHVGRLRSELDARGLEDTLLVVSSDHGEELGDHGDVGHRFRPYEHNVRVATFFNHPDLPTQLSDGSATLLEIAPTICHFAGASTHPAWEGRSLLDSPPEQSPPIVFETFFGSPCDFGGRPIYFACRSGRWKLHWMEATDPRDPSSVAGPRLFDLVRDPDEHSDVSRTHPEITESLLSWIRRRRRELLNENGLTEESSIGKTNPVHHWAGVA